jgi:hypothetical protein
VRRPRRTRGTHQRCQCRVSGFCGPSTLLLRDFPGSAGRTQCCHSAPEWPSPLSRRAQNPKAHSCHRDFKHASLATP